MSPATDDAAGLDATREPGSLSLYATLVSVASLCGLLVVGAYELTEGRVGDNLQRARERAILRALPGARRSVAFVADESGRFRPARGGEDPGEGPFAGYDEAGRLVGLALEAKGTGYQDVIRLLYGYSPARQAVVGLVVLESRETPGLGDAIESPGFGRNFERLDASLGPDEKLAHPIEVAAPGSGRRPWQVDAISGATVSSRAVVRIVGESSARWVPRLWRHAEDFSGGSGKDLGGGERP